MDANTVYQLRKDDGSSEDYWPLSTHRTLNGAITRLHAEAKKRGMTVSEPTQPDEFPNATWNGSELFINDQAVED